MDNDAGGISTYSQAGAQFGYTLLWSLIPMTIALYVSEEMCARMGVVTGKGLSDLIREEFGFRSTFFVMVAALFVDLFNTVAEFSGVAEASEVMHVSRYVSVPLAAMAVWLLVVYGSYRIVEKIFLVACGFYLSYVLSAFWPSPIGCTRRTNLWFPRFISTRRICLCSPASWEPPSRPGNFFIFRPASWKNELARASTNTRAWTSSSVASPAW